MRRLLLMVWVVFILACLPLVVGATVVPLLVDDFNGDTVGGPVTGWKLVVTVDGTSATIVDDGTGNLVADFHDDNSLVGTTKNNTMWRGFPAVVEGSGTTGIVTAQLDVNLAQLDAGFGVRLTNGGTATSGGSWATGLIFEGNEAYAAGGGGGAGLMSYQAITTGAGAYLLCPPGVFYSANTWFTVKIVANVNSKKYQIFFGPKGTDPLPEITPNPGVGVDFIRTLAGNQVSQIAGIAFLSSVKSSDGPGDLWIDNIHVEGDVTIDHLDNAADVKTAAKESLAEITGKVVTAGTDQVFRPFFYIQDDTGGVRVRVKSDQVVHQGDKVDVVGTVTRASDNGTVVKHNGEKEINATGITANVSVTPGPFALPDPIGITNRQMGGGDFGPIDTDGYVAQPGVYKSGTSPNQVPEDGLNNVGRYARIWGRVVYSVNDTTGRFMYIDDGSGVIDGSTFTPPGGVGPQIGVRVPLRFTTAGIDGQFAIVTGVVGSVSASELVTGSGINNVRIMRPLGEPFTDTNADGIWEDGEPFVDANNNGVWDSGIVFLP